MDRDLVDSLFARYREPVYRFLRRMLRDGPAAEDLTQDTFLRAMNGRYQANGNERAWIFQIARNLARDRARAHQRRPALIEYVDHNSASADPSLALALDAAMARLVDERPGGLPAAGGWRPPLRGDRGHMRADARRGAVTAPPRQAHAQGRADAGAWFRGTTMNEMHSELMSAFVDDEAVDPASLAIAFEDGQARQVLVDFVRLREAARQAEGEIPPSLAAFRRQPVWRMAVPLPAVAALVLVAVLASWFMPRAAGIDGPPDPPAPARTLTFEPGVDWREWQP